MALPNIHVFIDDEVITADDLNSIGEAVSSEIGSGNIASSSLVWPLVAQGDIDMNGYSINNIAAFLGVYHVNDSFTLQNAIEAVNSASGGKIILDPGSSSVVAGTVNDVITASNVTIEGAGGNHTITVSGSATPYGMRATGNYFTLRGCQFTGGVTTIPCVQIDTALGAKVRGNTFSACVGPCLALGTTSNNLTESLVEENNFAYCSEQGIVAHGLIASTLDCNSFFSVDGNGIEIAGDAGSFAECVISNNVFRSGDAPCIYGERSGVLSSSFGNIVISGNSCNTSSTTYHALELDIYVNCTITGNTFQDPVSLKVERSVFSGNCVNEAIEFNCTTTVFTGNNFRSTILRTSGANNTFTGNQFEAAIEIDAAWIDSFVGNKCENGVTITATEPDVVGLNWGY